MNTDIHTDLPTNQLQEAAQDVARGAADAAGEAGAKANIFAREWADATKDAARRVTKSAKDLCQAAAVRTGESLETSKEYVRQNPVPVVLGAIAFGAALGCLVMMARRKPTFGERYNDEPLAAVREAILGAFKPVTHSVHQGYDSACDGAGKAMHRLQSFGKGRHRGAISDRIGRIGKSLKFR